MDKSFDLDYIKNSIRSEFLNKYKASIKRSNFNEDSELNRSTRLNENSGLNRNCKLNRDSELSEGSRLKKGDKLNENSRFNGNIQLNREGKLNEDFTAGENFIRDKEFFEEEFIKIGDFRITEMAVKSCPHCKSSNFIKYGRYKNTPRFMCNCCGRTFSARTKTPWYYSKKTDEHWRIFINLLMRSQTLMTCSTTLKINVATAFYWRHKILNAMKSTTETTLLSNQVFIMNYFINESFKGSHNAPIIPREKLWVAMSVDTCDHTLALPYCKSRWNKEKFTEIIYSKIETKAYLSTSGNRYIKAIVCQHNKYRKAPIYGENHVDNEIGSNKEDILRFIFTYKGIMNRAHGIATKYLNQYFALAKILYSDIGFNGSLILEAVQNTMGYIKSYNINKIRCI